MFVRTAASPCTVTVTFVGAAAEAVLSPPGAVTPLAAATAPSPAAIAVRLLKSMPPADTHRPPPRVTRKSARPRKRVGVAP
ncbi:hypothetical protein [Streptomyces violarus]|uniref:Uncharacterized protein n=1 Tax=Streptomyces violarus TaxID=67380 RepID=A0A7W4ZXH7_9ACTN|nr:MULTISPECIES: hypothetical protein [Streptomyces]MBB3080292.1 hypothetical protein [Streptomyces violarus]WRU00727.1 hypothetical protein VJ737_24955 [Streptomyces sp. CGMCC 4.1772]